eukprot:jgi/Antlo1/985/1820
MSETDTLRPEPTTSMCLASGQKGAPFHRGILCAQEVSVLNVATAASEKMSSTLYGAQPSSPESLIMCAFVLSAFVLGAARFLQILSPECIMH